MRILMLGWEFPPFISGGLGTACYGLTRALNEMGVEILFVLPKAVPTDYSGHVRLLSPGMGTIPGSAGSPGTPGSVDLALSEFDHVTFRTINANVRALEGPRGGRTGGLGCALGVDPRWESVRQVQVGREHGGRSI